MKLLEDHMWEILGSLTFNNYQMLLCSEVLAQKVTIDLDELCAVKTCSSVVSVFPLGFSTIFIAELYENWYHEISFLYLTAVVTDFALHCVHRTVAHSILMLLGRAQTSIDILFCSPGTYRRCLATTCPSLLTDKLHWKTEHYGKKWPKKSQLGKEVIPLMIHSYTVWKLSE